MNNDKPNAIEIEFDNNDRVDMTVYKTRSGTRVFLGRGSSVVSFPLEGLDQFIQFLNKAKKLPIQDW